VLGYGLLDLLCLRWLVQDLLHADVFAPLHVGRVHVGCQRQDDDSRTVRARVALLIRQDTRGSVEAVHDRHVEVHEHQAILRSLAEGIRAARSGFFPLLELVECLLTVRCRVWLEWEQVLYYNLQGFQVEDAVIHDKDGAQFALALRRLQ